MIVDAMALLADANPVLAPPPVEPIERLRRLIEDDRVTVGDGDGRTAHTGSTRARRPSSSRARALAALLAATATAVGVAITDEPSGPSVNVAAAAYAATSTGTGVAEAVFVDRVYSGGRVLRTFQHREWIDAAAGRRREQSSFPSAAGLDSETASSPGQFEVWNDTRAEAGVIHRVLTPNRVNAGTVETSPGEAEGIALYRRLYQQGPMRLIGRERHNDRLLWKLESAPTALGVPRTGSKPVPLQCLIVLVDPNTFLPISERQINLYLPGHPVASESDLVRYRRLPRDASSEDLLSIVHRHPRATVIVIPAPGGRPRGAHAGK
jgi:hypothetical protein